MSKIIVLLLISLSCHGQTLQELKAQIDVTQGQVNQIRLNLDKCHRQYQAGVAITAIAIVLTTVVALTPNEDTFEGQKVNHTKEYVMGAGSVLSLSGMIVIINSHKYLSWNGLNR